MNQQGEWQVAGSAPEVYERELVPAVFAVWAPILVELAKPRAGERVLDVACGTGIVARTAAKHVGPTGTVVGVDLNPGMLTVARSVTDSRSGGSLQWQEANANELPFPDDSFDIVYCQLGLQFFADRAAALREMHRVLTIYKLIDEYNALFNPDLARLIIEDDSEPGQQRIKAVPITEFPSSIPLIIGDAVHNLRTAFDYIVVAITGLDWIALPVGKTRDDVSKAQHYRTIEETNPGLAKFIIDERPQPLRFEKTRGPL